MGAITQIVHQGTLAEMLAFSPPQDNRRHYWDVISGTGQGDSYVWFGEWKLDKSNGAALVSELPVSAASTPVVQGLNGGQSVPVAIASPGIYRVESDVDTYVAGSSIGGVNGLTFGATDVLSIGGGAAGDLSLLISGNALDFGASSFSVELFAALSDTITSAQSIFAFGDTAGTELVVRMHKSGNDLVTDIRVIDSTNTNILDPATGNFSSSFTFTNGYDAGLLHLVFGVDRINKAVSCWLQTVFQTNEVATMSTATLNASDVASSGDVVVAGNVNGVAGFAGVVYAVRTYKSLLTQAQVNTRNGLGPARLATDGISPSLVFNLNARDSWANAGEPEAVDINGDPVVVFATVTGLILDNDIAAIDGGTVAGIENTRLLANLPEKIFIEDEYVNLYSLPESSGTVRLTKV